MKPGLHMADSDLPILMVLPPLSKAGSPPRHPKRNLSPHTDGPAVRPYLKRSASASGMMLIECLVYISIAMVLAGLALGAFYQGWNNHRNLTRVSDDILQTLRAGEQWRADIRQTIAEPRGKTNQAGHLLHLPQRNGEVIYAFRTNGVWRRSSAGVPWAPVLSRVKSSRMVPEVHAHVTAWRWELTLETPRQQARLQPLFTFKAVPGPRP